MTLRYIDKA